MGELTNNFQGQNIKTKTSWQLVNINDSLYYDTATLEEVTDQFQVTDDPNNPSTKIFKSNLPIDSGFYVVDEGLYISNDENFVGSLTPILLDKDGNEISQVKFDATSTLVKESMQAMAQVINTSSCKPHKILEITKLDEKTGKALAGAKFKVSNPDGSLVEELVTDANGKASLRLLLGKYT